MTEGHSPGARLALAVAWLVVAFEIGFVAAVAVPAPGPDAAPLVLLALAAVVAAGFAAWVAEGPPVARGAYAALTGVVAGGTTYGILWLIGRYEGEGSMYGFFAMCAVWLVAYALALWRLRSDASLGWFGLGSAVAVVGLVALPALGSHVAELGGNDALSGILVLASPAFAAVSVLAIAATDVMRRRVTTGREASA